MRQRSDTEAVLALGRPLPRAFYARSSLVLARAILGRLLIHETAEGPAGGFVVEAEAYRGRHDPASHAYRGLTPRTTVMFGPPGHAYVYFSYGMHHCLNLVSEREGEAGAVLVRALEPAIGIPLMAKRRGAVAWDRLTRGPGCVAQALGLTRSHNGLDLVQGPLWLSDLPPRRDGLTISAGARIGIRQGADLPWRFHLASHPCVSGPRLVRGTAPGSRRSAIGPSRDRVRGSIPR